jgi:hypothetical protein
MLLPCACRITSLRGLHFGVIPHGYPSLLLIALYCSLHQAHVVCPAAVVNTEQKRRNVINRFCPSKSHIESTKLARVASPLYGAIMARGGCYGLSRSYDHTSCHTHYRLEIKSGNRSRLRRLHETLESAMDCFHPPLSARVRSHIVEGAHGEGKPVVFCVEDSFEIQ